MKSCHHYNLEKNVNIFSKLKRKEIEEKTAKQSLNYFEANALENAPFQPHTWLRYIDDIFMIGTEGPDNLRNFHRLS